MGLKQLRKAPQGRAPSGRSSWRRNAESAAGRTHRSPLPREGNVPVRLGGHHGPVGCRLRHRRRRRGRGRPAVKAAQIFRSQRNILGYSGIKYWPEPPASKLRKEENHAYVQPVGPQGQRASFLQVTAPALQKGLNTLKNQSTDLSLLRREASARPSVPRPPRSRTPRCVRSPV